MNASDPEKSTSAAERERRPERPRREIPAFPILDPQLHEDRTQYTPFIVLRSDDPAFPIWLSPNIFVTDALNTLVLSPKVGTPYTVWALVSNLGIMDAVNVNVRFWWANPSVAITEASAHAIGVATGVHIPGTLSAQGTSVAVPCPGLWTPEFENGGHECLLAKAWCPGFDPAAPSGPEPPLDLGNRYSAQRNLTVIQAPPGQAFSLRLEVANIARFAMEATVEVRSLRHAHVKHGLYAANRGVEQRLLETDGPLPLEVAFSEERSFRHAPNRTFARLLHEADEALMHGRAAARSPRGGVAFRRVVRLDAWERRTLDIAGQVPRTARPGQAWGIEVSEYLGDVLVGGYTAFVVVARD